MALLGSNLRGRGVLWRDGMEAVMSYPGQHGQEVPESAFSKDQWFLLWSKRKGWRNRNPFKCPIKGTVYTACQVNWAQEELNVKMYAPMSACGAPDQQWVRDQLMWSKLGEPWACRFLEASTKSHLGKPWTEAGGKGRDWLQSKACHVWPEWTHRNNVRKKGIERYKMTASFRTNKAAQMYLFPTDMRKKIYCV